MTEALTTLPLGELQGRALSHVQEAWKHSEMAVKHAWHAGQLFNLIHKRMPHGTWQGWLDERCIGRETARVWRQIADNMTLEQAIAAGSIRGAVKELKPAPTPRTPVEELEPVEQGTVWDDADTLRARAEKAERERDEAMLQLDEERERAAVVLAGESDDSRADDIMSETPQATQATRVARSELERVQERLKVARDSVDRANRKLNAVLDDLLAGKDHDEILAAHWGLKRKAAATTGDEG